MHFDQARASLFTSTPTSFNLKLHGLYLELGRNYFDAVIKNEVFSELKQMELVKGIQNLFSDNLINFVEKHQVSHVAWRDRQQNFSFSLQQKIEQEWQRAEQFAQAVIAGEYRSYSDELITDIVSVGIGGSFLGNALVCNALQDFSHGKFKGHFLTAPDPALVNDLLQQLNPKTTLWLFNSKSFTTFETLSLYQVIKKWFLTSSPEEALAKHFFAITSQVDRAQQQGFQPEQIFWFDEGVGGRFSLWSTCGLMILLMLGLENHKTLLAGAHAMDQHFKAAPLEKNIPVCLAWLDYYYNIFLKAKSRVVVPYSGRLELLPSYLQQTEMESLGKSVHRNGDFSTDEMGLAVWGGIGPNGQHAFHQFLYQSEQLIPVEFIAVKKSSVFPDLQKMQLAQCLAQAKALWQGDMEKENTFEKIKGGKPSTLIILDELNPFNLGALLAMYEHKVFILGELYDINAFDQFGVELGKKLARPMLASFLNGNSNEQALDEITEALITLLKQS